ncbi:MAG TPA: histidine kinase [Chryseolinea sp.]|nr:histidine kinase [Chryseolinea sp.]
MKIRWREHELTLATLVGLILLSGYFWRLYHFTSLQIESTYRACFTARLVDFNLYRNVVLPDIGMGVLLYLSYLFINRVTIPRLFRDKKNALVNSAEMQTGPAVRKPLITKDFRKYLWFIIPVSLIILILGIGFNIAAYLQNECYFIYPGFTFFPGNGSHPMPLLDLSSGFRLSLNIVLLYALYAAVREITIALIERGGIKKAYLVLVCNQVTAFLVIYLSIPIFAAVFRVTHDGDLISGYFTIIIPIFLVFLSNTYWLFPLTERHPFFGSHIIVRLLISTFLATLTSLLFPFFEGFRAGILGTWGIQLFAVTPVTWLYFQQRKDKILQFRGIEKALVKSTADLQFLRSQINPHFLFNSLNTLYGTALQEHADRTAEGIQKLGDMMRFMLHENNLDFIRMDKEIEYLKNYISLQKLRTQSSPSIIIEENINEHNCNHTIAPMLLIPLVENAFKHGISLKESSWIKISLDCTDKEIVFKVRNSMHPVQDHDPEKETSGIGLKNVMDRLKLIYPGRHRISVTGDEKEFSVQLVILPK